MSSKIQEVAKHENQEGKLPEEAARSPTRRSRTKRTTSSSTHPASSLSGVKEETEPRLSKQSSQKKAAFNSFRSLCPAKGLLKRPVGIDDEDVPEGIYDDGTLLCVPPYSILKGLNALAPFRHFNVRRPTVQADDSSPLENKTSETRINNLQKPAERVM